MPQLRLAGNCQYKWHETNHHALGLITCLLSLLSKRPHTRQYLFESRLSVPQFKHFIVFGLELSSRTVPQLSQNLNSSELFAPQVRHFIFNFLLQWYICCHQKLSYLNSIRVLGKVRFNIILDLFQRCWNHWRLGQPYRLKKRNLPAQKSCGSFLFCQKIWLVLYYRQLNIPRRLSSIGRAIHS